MEYSSIQRSIQQWVSDGSWFRGLGTKDIQQIAKKATIKKFKKGEFLYIPGDVQTNFYYMVSGKVQVSIIAYQGNQFILTTMKSGDWFGEGAVLESKTRVLESEVLIDSELLVIPLDAVKAIAGTEPNFYRNILRDHMLRTQVLYELIGGMLFLPLRARLAGRLLYLLELFGEPCDDGFVIESKFSQMDFARMSMGSRQRINKIFREWEAKGIYKKAKGRYIIMDVEAMKLELDADDDA